MEFLHSTVIISTIVLKMFLIRSRNQKTYTLFISLQVCLVTFNKWLIRYKFNETVVCYKDASMNHLNASLAGLDDTAVNPPNMGYKQRK